MRVSVSDFCKDVSTDLCRVECRFDGVFVMDMMKTRSKEFKADVSFLVLTRQEVTARVDSWMSKYGAGELPWA